MNKKEIIELLNKNNIENVSESDMNFLENLSKLNDEQLDLVEKMMNKLKEK